MRQMIIASTSKLHGQKSLQYLEKPLKNLLGKRKTLLFIPFARPGGISHQAYTEHISAVFPLEDLKVRGLHEFEDSSEAIAQAEAIFVGGGNTFVLLQALMQRGLLEPLKQAIQKAVSRAQPERKHESGLETSHKCDT